MYYLSDNFTWVFSLLISSKVYKHKELKKWKDLKNNFSISRIIISIIKNIWHIRIRNKKAQELEDLLKNAPIKKIEKHDLYYESTQKLLKLRRKKRFDYLKLVIDLQRFVMLYKSLHNPGWKSLDPIFVSLCGVGSATFTLLRTI